MEILVIGFTYFQYLLLFVIGLLTLWWYTRKPRNLPPGPYGIPFFGSLPLLGSFPPRYLAKLGEKYGPIFSVFFGSELNVVLNDYESARRAFVENAEVFGGRPHSLCDILVTNGKDILTSEGPRWKLHRVFAEKVFLNYDQGKLNLEPAILEEIQEFMYAIDARHDEAFDMLELLETSLCNDVCIIAFGRRFQYSDPNFSEFRNLIYEYSCFARAFKNSSFFPITRTWPILRTCFGHEDFKKLSKQIDSVLQTIVKDHTSHWKVGEKGCYVDAYLSERETRKASNRFDDVFDNDTLIKTLRVLFGTGTEPTCAIMQWVFIYLMGYPDVQTKIQQEIDLVIGHKRQPTMADRNRMPYTVATLMEVQRKVTVVPFLGPHCTTKDVELAGYKIPERTTVFMNAWGIHHDPMVWSDPHTFRPERFINEHGMAVKPQALLTFGLGERCCVGEPVARMQAFLYLTSMLQKYTVKMPEGVHVSADYDSFSVVIHPKPYLLRVIRRRVQ